MGPMKLTRIVRQLCKLMPGDHLKDLKGMKVCSCNCLSAQHLFPRVKPVLWNHCVGAIQLPPIPTLPSQGFVSWHTTPRWCLVLGEASQWIFCSAFLLLSHQGKIHNKVQIMILKVKATEVLHFFVTGLWIILMSTLIWVQGFVRLAIGQQNHLLAHELTWRSLYSFWHSIFNCAAGSSTHVGLGAFEMEAWENSAVNQDMFYC